jgi:hypothetical protein
VCIDNADARSHQSVKFDEVDDVIIVCSRRNGKRSQERKNFLTVAQIAASQLAHYERMTYDLAFRQQC